MMDFKSGFEFFQDNYSVSEVTMINDAYSNSVNEEINKLIEGLNGFKGYNTDVKALKGDVAELYHAGTFNINASVNHSSNRAFVDRSHDFASADISTNYGEKYGLKYYQNGVQSAKAQSESYFQRFQEYKSKGGTSSFEEFLRERGINENEVLASDPIYSGQVRIIPSDQLEEAIKWLEYKIEKEKITRPEQVKRYQETLDLLKSKISDGQGNQSNPLSADEAQKLAQLAKEGEIDLDALGISLKDLITYKRILSESCKAGITAATITALLKVMPVLLESVSHVIKEEKIDINELKDKGEDILIGSSEAFINGSISSAIILMCKTGRMGEGLVNASPSIVAVATIVAVDTIKNSIKVAMGEMSQGELVEEFVKESYISIVSITFGSLAQSIIPIPYMGFLIGNFIGSIVGGITYDKGYNKFMSFCVDSGLTLFGLVEQNYELPEEILKEIGLDLVDWDEGEWDRPSWDEGEWDRPSWDEGEWDRPEIRFIRRGVIGVFKVGYIF